MHPLLLRVNLLKSSWIALHLHPRIPRYSTLNWECRNASWIAPLRHALGPSPSPGLQLSPSQCLSLWMCCCCQKSNYLVQGFHSCESGSWNSVLSTLSTFIRKKPTSWSWSLSRINMFISLWALTAQLNILFYSLDCQVWERRLNSSEIIRREGSSPNLGDLPNLGESANLSDSPNLGDSPSLGESPKAEILSEACHPITHTLTPG